MNGMPTPVGHALGALIVTAPIRARYRLLGAGALVAVLAGVSPDLDLLAGRHSAETHSIGAGLIAGLAGWAVFRWRGGALAPAWGALIACAVLSHALLDWLGTDTSAPIGIMALWPFSRGYFEADAHVFMAVSRRYWLSEFWTYNLTVLARELIILGIPAAFIEWRMRKTGTGPVHRA